MADQETPSHPSDATETQKHTVSSAYGDGSELVDQPPLKKSASNVPITLNIRYKTQTFAVQCDLHDTLKELKDKLDKLTDVDPQVQKLVNKSITSVKRDDATTTLKDLNLIDGQTLLLVGATRADILSTNEVKSGASASKDSSGESASASTKKEPLCKQTRHEKVLKAGETFSSSIFGSRVIRSEKRHPLTLMLTDSRSASHCQIFSSGSSVWMLFR